MDYLWYVVAILLALNTYQAYKLRYMRVRYTALLNMLTEELKQSGDTLQHTIDDNKE